MIYVYVVGRWGNLLKISQKIESLNKNDLCNMCFLRIPQKNPNILY